MCNHLPAKVNRYGLSRYDSVWQTKVLVPFSTHSLVILPLFLNLKLSENNDTSFHNSCIISKKLAVKFLGVSSCKTRPKHVFLFQTLKQAAQPFTGPRLLAFCLYTVCENSKGSGEGEGQTEHLHSLTKTSVVCSYMSVKPSLCMVQLLKTY